MKRTISAEVGKGSVNHNSRKFRAENVDGSRTHLNIDYRNERIQTVSGRCSTTIIEYWAAITG